MENPLGTWEDFKGILAALFDPRRFRGGEKIIPIRKAWGNSLLMVAVVAVAAFPVGLLFRNIPAWVAALMQGFGSLLALWGVFGLFEYGAWAWRPDLDYTDRVISLSYRLAMLTGAFFLLVALWTGRF